jgi:hypothetical protein
MTWMDSEETGKLSGANLFVLSPRKGHEKKLEIEKLRQHGPGKKSHQARTVRVGRSATSSIPDTRFGRANDWILNDDLLQTCDDLR